MKAALNIHAERIGNLLKIPVVPKVYIHDFVKSLVVYFYQQGEVKDLHEPHFTFENERLFFFDRNETEYEVQLYLYGYYDLLEKYGFGYKEEPESNEKYGVSLHD